MPYIVVHGAIKTHKFKAHKFFERSDSHTLFTCIKMSLTVCWKRDSTGTPVEQDKTEGPSTVLVR